MKNEEFKRRSEIAVHRAYEIAKFLVRDRLPERYKIYHVVGNDKHVVYDDVSKMADELFTEKGVPTWVDLVIRGVLNGDTIIICRSSHEYTDNEEFSLVHKEEGIPPFHVKGPSTPSYDYDPNIHGKFWLKDTDNIKNIPVDD